MGKSPVTSKAEQVKDIDSLNVYMRGVNELGNFSSEQQNRLCQSFDECADELRRQVCSIGFTAEEYLRSIAGILDKGIDAADVFVVSALRKMGSGPAAQLKALRQYQQEISEKYTQWQKIFAENGDCSQIRSEMVELLMRNRLSLQRIYELLDVGAGYVRMLSPDFEWGRKFNGINCEVREFIGEKFLLDVDELPEYTSRIGEAVEQLNRIRNKLVEANLKLVVSIARRYCNQKILLEDLIQEGNLGLLRALERIDFSLGYRFSTYASWWIRHRIVRAVNNCGRVIRLPMHMVKLINDINQAEQRFIQMNDREPEVEELAKILELPVARVSAVKKMAVQTVSLQTHIGSDEDSAELGDFIADSAVESPEAALNRRVLKERLYEMLKTLTQREQQLLIMRFGLFGQPVYTLAEISTHFKLTRERCRQIELQLLAKLRSPEKLKFIDGAVHFEDF